MAHNRSIQGRPLFLSLLLWLSLLAGAAGGDAQVTPETVTVAGGENGQFLVKFKTEISRSTAEALLIEEGTIILDRIPRLGIWLVQAAQSAPPYSLILPRSAVAWAEVNGTLLAAESVTPNDNYFLAQQGNLRRLNLPEAWVVTTGDNRPIAIVDTGLDLDHPDLTGKVWRNPGEIAGNEVDDDGNGFVDDVTGWDFVQDDPWPEDDNGHGSHVAGIAGAQTNNQLGIAGVAWQNPLLPLKALRQDARGTYADIAAAIVYAAGEGARVINLSLGDPEPSNTVTAAIAYAQGRGCLVVAATGNEGEAVFFPATVPGVLGVGATDSSGSYDLPWTFSNWGPEVDVAAPGVKIFSTIYQGGYYAGTGTSMATPHVSGLAALLWAADPALSAEEVATIIEESARDIYTAGWDSRTGWGLVDARRALRRVVPHEQYLPVVSGSGG